MKKWLKRLGLGVGVVLVLAVSAAMVFFYVLHPKLRDAPTVSAPTTSEAIARGKYLAHHVNGCAVCHSPIDEAKAGDAIIESQLFAGRQFPDPEFPGTLVAPNLTPDKARGIGAWTDGELMRAIREGVSRDGRTLFPMMPYTHLKHLTDEDTLAIIAYLRTVPAVSNDKLPRMEVGFPVSMFIRLAPEPLAKSPPAWPHEPAKRGALLLETMGCVSCHTPMDKGQPIEAKKFAGGMKFAGAFGTVHASNITPDAATGIGAYSDDDLMRVFREGKGKDGRTLWVMPWRAYQGATDDDLRAVIAALREVKPVTNTVPAPKLRAAVSSAN